MSTSHTANGTYAIRPADTVDFDEILRLNAEWTHFTSDLDEAVLTHLHTQAVHHRVVEVTESSRRIVAFLLALREGADYDSPNFRWFDERGGTFIYVDRVIVDRSEQGNGIATMLYDDLFSFAGSEGIEHIVCELDVDPPNEASRRFHDNYGFREIGTQWIAGGTKRVSLRQADVC